MRVSWLEAICVVAIAVATLQLPVSERGGRLFTPPMTLPMVKEMLVANAAIAVQHARESGSERKR